MIVASYLVGSLPFGLLLAKAVGGPDPRESGSGNVGATNVARAVGKHWFPVALFLDAAKGAIPVLFLAPIPFTDPEVFLPSRLAQYVHLDPVNHSQVFVAAACGGAAVAGHVWSVFLRFRGGKGVATTAGALAALAWLPLLGSVAVFGTVLLASGFVSLASVAAAIAMPLLAWWDEQPNAVLWFSATVAVVIVIRHHTNLYRIVTGTEPGLHTSAPSAEPQGETRV